MKVRTSLGDIERSALTAKDIVTEGEEARVVATEWYFGAEIVRRDVWVNGLRPCEIGVKHVE